MHIYNRTHNIIDLQEVIILVFKIKSGHKETENKTIRFPLSLTQEIEQAIKGEDVTFSSFVIQACEYALDNMEKNSQDK